MFARRRILSAFVVGSLLAGTGVALAQSNVRVPSGHSYSPKQQALPQLNSRQDRINSRADIYESEIYRSNRETAITFGNMRIFGRDNLLRGGSSNRPRY